jgi:hypothetical protein
MLTSASQLSGYVRGLPFSTFPRRLLLGLAFCAVFSAHLPAAAQVPAPRQTSRQDPELRQAIEKSNAYIGLMNRTLRASESWRRYTSWVNVKTGPTGRERYIDYGLYSLYDVRGEITKAQEATTQPPLQTELDATMKRYIDVYQALAPLLTRANGYYERKDYKSDNMAEGRELHAKLVPAAEAFLRERATLDQQMLGFKRSVSALEIAEIEKLDGRNARWHVKNVMMNAEEIVEMLPSNAAPVVNMPGFDEVLARYASAVREMDMFSQENPGKFSGFESQPRSLLGKLRDFRDKLARAKGDARRGAGQDLTWIVNDYNMMVTFSRNATSFGR